MPWELSGYGRPSFTRPSKKASGRAQQTPEHRRRKNRRKR